MTCLQEHHLDRMVVSQKAHGRTLILENGQDDIGSSFDSFESSLVLISDDGSSGDET